MTDGDFFALIDGNIRRPKESVRVTIVDNSEAAMQMWRILKRWPNLSVILLVQSGGSRPVIDKSCDIVLIDENLIGITGTQVATNLRNGGFRGIIASVTPGRHCPSCFRYHFGEKELIATSVKMAAAFAKWMSALVEEVEKKRP